MGQKCGIVQGNLRIAQSLSWSIRFPLFKLNRDSIKAGSKWGRRKNAKMLGKAPSARPTARLLVIMLNVNCWKVILWYCKSAVVLIFRRRLLSSMSSSNKKSWISALLCSTCLEQPQMNCFVHYREKKCWNLVPLTWFQRHQVAWWLSAHIGFPVPHVQDKLDLTHKPWESLAWAHHEWKDAPLQVRATFVVWECYETGWCVRVVLPYMFRQKAVSLGVSTLRLALNGISFSAIERKSSQMTLQTCIFHGAMLQIEA